MKKRLGNIDLLRIICAIFVVFEHFCEEEYHNAFLYAKNTSIGYYILLLFIYGFSRVAVPVFFIISGYLSIDSQNQKLGKIINLFLMTIAFSFIEPITKIVLGDTSIQISRLLFKLLAKNYYLYLYVALYALSPFINKGLKVLNKNQFKRLIIIGMSLFIVWSTIINILDVFTSMNLFGTNFIGAESTQNGFNLINFTMLYIVGAYLKLYYVPKYSLKEKIIPLSIMTLSSIVITIVTIAYYPLVVALVYYDSVIIVASAISIFVLFLNIGIKENRLMSFFGKATFGTYLLNPFAVYLLEKIVTIEKLVTSSIFTFIASILIFVLGAYIITALISQGLLFIVSPINNKWKKTKAYNLRLYAE